MKELGNVSTLFTVERQRVVKSLALDMSAYILGNGDENSLPHNQS